MLRITVDDSCEAVLQQLADKAMGCLWERARLLLAVSPDRQRAGWQRLDRARLAEAPSMPGPPSQRPLELRWMISDRRRGVSASTA